MMASPDAGTTPPGMPSGMKLVVQLLGFAIGIVLVA